MFDVTTNQIANLFSSITELFSGCFDHPQPDERSVFEQYALVHYYARLSLPKQPMQGFWEQLDIRLVQSKGVDGATEVAILRQKRFPEYQELFNELDQTELLKRGGKNNDDIPILESFASQVFEKVDTRADFTYVYRHPDKIFDLASRCAQLPGLFAIKLFA